MRLSGQKLLVGAMMTLLTWLLGAGYAVGQTAPERDAPNRARASVVSASGMRLARLDEVPMSKTTTANVALAMASGWTRWVPRYAIDGSPLTKWAAEGSDSNWIQFKIGNRLMSQPAVSALAIVWGKAHATSYRVMGSTDGIYWKQVAVRDQGRGGVEVIEFSPPIQVSALRVEVVDVKGAGVEIVDVGIYGVESENAPATVKGLTATALGPDRIELKWEPPADGLTWRYRVFRAEGAAPELNRSNLIETISSVGLVDHGLNPGRTYHYKVVALAFGGKPSRPVARVEAATIDGPTFARFEHRGIIEGFYNDPWPHQERLAMMSFLEDAGMNYYCYAPKVEVYHRQWWYKPYPEAEMKNFAELAAAARAHGITFNYGISPGLDMNLSKAGDVARLKEKLDAMRGTGIRAFTICLDDIPKSRSANRKIGEDHVRVVNEVFDHLRAQDPGTEVFFVPTVYSRTYSHHKKKRSAKAGYLEAIAGLRPEIGIMWTGPGEVFSKEINKSGAMELKELWSRPVLIWDNYPVNDMLLRNNVFTGPYLGRSLDLGDAVGGIFLNPMYLPHASKISLFAAGKYMTDPDYEPWKAYDQALRFLGGESGYHALKAVSDCLLPHPVFPQLTLDDVPIQKLIERYWSTRANPGQNREAEAQLRDAFAELASNPMDLVNNVADQGLTSELLPLSQKLSLYGAAGTKCLEALSERDPEANVNLRAEIIDLQARARLIPWAVVDERTSLPMAYVGARLGRRNALDDFITRALSEIPR